MTWFASGIAFAGLGADIEGRGAFADALPNIADIAGADDVRISVERLAGAASRAVRRWTGDDDLATPFLSRDADRRRQSRLRLEVGRNAVAADRSFVTFIVPPGADELTLTFLDDGLLSAATSLSPHWVGGHLDSGEDTYVLVDAFVGDSTIRQTAMAKVTGGLARLTLRLGGQIAVLLGTRLRVRAHTREMRDTDPSWDDRLHSLERKAEYAHLAMKHPTLHAATRGPAPIAVLVHGTFSCCVPALPALSGLAGTTTLYRFEHDTMRPVMENVEELVDLLQQIGSTEVTLLGHSRGGLVATAAASNSPSVTKVLTFGTPHNGTPLAASQDDLLGHAVASIGTQVKSILDGGLYAAHIGSMLPPGGLPDGWTDMLPHSSFIRLLRQLPRRAVTAYGGIFDGAQPGLGLGPALSSMAMAELMDGGHDLVVPVISSKPYELPGAELEQVHHFGYFDDAVARTHIKQALQPTTPRTVRPTPKRRAP